MKFRQRIKNNCFVIECIPTSASKVPENMETPEIVGYRAEAPHPKIILKTREVRFNLIPKKIHPDLLALICVVIFYPFFEPNSNTVFPEKVSAVFASELRTVPIYGYEEDRYKVLQGASIYVNNSDIDDNLRSYKGKGGSLLSFGGGLDSLATYSLFSALTIVHEKDERLSAKSGVEVLLDKIGHRAFVIETNSRTLTEPVGWTGWIGCIATSLLVATDLGTTNIVLGSSMGAIIGSCAKFREKGLEFPMNSIWSKFLDKIGLKLVTPILGLSELALIKLIDRDLLEYCIWCEKDRGYPCKKCSKCFRRYLLLADHLDKVRDWDWDKYDNIGVYSLLRGSKGPTLRYLLEKNRQNLPNWIIHRSDLSRLERPKEDSDSCLYSWYHRSLRYLPESLRTYVYRRIAEKVRPMTDPEMDLFEKVYGRDVPL